MRCDQIASFLFSAFAATVTLDTTAAELPPKGVIKVAVLEGNGLRAPRSGVVDVLQAALTRDPAVVVLERQRIQEILQEQELTAAEVTSSDHAVRLGGLLGADLFAVVEGDQGIQTLAQQTHGEGAELQQIRILDTRTGIVLVSQWCDARELLEDPSRLTRVTKLAINKKRSPGADRVSVAVHAVKDEQPGPDCGAVARALSLLLPHHLSQSPTIWVLDREHLKRVQDETNMTDLKTALRTSTSLVTVGLRHTTEGPRHATVRIEHVSSGETQIFDVDVSELKGGAISQRLAERILNVLGTAPPTEARAAPKAEAVAFLSQALSHLSHGEFAKALRAAEAAYALDANPGTHFGLTLAAYHDPRLEWFTEMQEEGHLTTKRKLEIYDALIRAKRLEHENALRFDGAPLDPSLFTGIPSVAVWGTARPMEIGLWSRIPRIAPRQDERDVMERASELLAQEKKMVRHRLDLCQEKAHLPDAKRYWWKNLQSATRIPIWISGSHQQWLDYLQEQIVSCISPPPEFDDRIAKHRFLSSLVQQGALAMFYRDPSSAGDFLVWLKSSEDVLIAMTGHVLETQLPGQDRQAWRQVADFFVEKLGHDHADRARFFDDGAPLSLLAMALAPVKKRADKAPYYRSILNPLIDAGESLRLTAALRALPDWMLVAQKGVSEGKFRTWTRRLLLALQYTPEQQERDNRLADKEQLDLATLRRNAERIRQNVERVLTELGEPLPIPEALRGWRWTEELALGFPESLGAKPSLGQGPWLCSAALHDGRLLSVWLHAQGGSSSCRTYVIVLSSSLEERKTVLLGKAKCRGDEPLPLHGLVKCLTVRGNELAFATANPWGDTLFLMRDGELKAIDTDAGLPADMVYSAAWSKDKLYLGLNSRKVDLPHRTTEPRRVPIMEHVSGGLYTYSPDTGDFAELASSRSIKGRHPLDGGATYSIGALLPDGSSNSLWFVVNALPMERCGLWRHDTISGSITQVWASQTLMYGVLIRCADRFVTRPHASGLRSVNPETGETADYPPLPTLSPLGNLTGFALTDCQMLMIRRTGRFANGRILGMTIVAAESELLFQGISTGRSHVVRQVPGDSAKSISFPQCLLKVDDSQFLVLTLDGKIWRIRKGADGEGGNRARHRATEAP